MLCLVTKFYHANLLMYDNDTINDDDLQLANADTLLGQLQRGRGAGFLRALRDDPSTVHPLLVECITNDSRWDSQIEDRADYYGRLCIATQMDMTPLDQFLRTVPDDRLGSRTFLAIETLGVLARLGRTSAITILRDYISYGPKWDAALRQLAEVPGMDATEGLADVICARFQTGEQMDKSAVYGIFVEPALNRLWQSFSVTNPCIARLLNEVREIESTYDWSTDPNYKSLPVVELLAVANARNNRHIEKILLSRLNHSDVNIYVSAFAVDNPFAWRIAFQCLAAMKRVAPFYDLILNKVVTYLESQSPVASDFTSGKRRVLELILLGIPTDMTLPLARRWFQSPQRHLRLIGEAILKEHATLDDLPHVQSALAAAVESATPSNTEAYRICAALDILTRFRDIGPVPEVETVFVQSGYSYARLRAARAMHANAPTWFAENYAYECLWDCEEEIRQMGCASVPNTIVGAIQRLRSMAEDPFESDLVKQAAAAALLLADHGGQI